MKTPIAERAIWEVSNTLRKPLRVSCDVVEGTCMNKSAIKSFAIWARNKLIADIGYKAGLLGVTDRGIKAPLPQSTKDAQYFDIGSREPYRITGAAIAQRKALADRIGGRAEQGGYADAYRAVIEEVAYTWFNRLVAIRFMEVNDYLPSRVRVLSSATGKAEPDIVTTPFETDLEFTAAERERVAACKDGNRLDELFQMLFIKQCNALNAILPELFEEIGDYTELLLNVSFADKDGIVWALTNGIDEEDFKEAVEIIGWMYQYYNTEPKDETFALMKKNVKITKDRIPAATQLFTPDWIVRYMVENSLGRLWLESRPASIGGAAVAVRVGESALAGGEGIAAEFPAHPDEAAALKSNWKYYIDEAVQTPAVEMELERIRALRSGMSPEDIALIDPCMGSGHILVYAFDVLVQIYESAGYSRRDAARLILERNIHGLDIDKRAYQLAYFALFMKARQHNRSIFDGAVSPQVYHPSGWPAGEEYGSLLKIGDPGEKPIQRVEPPLHDATYEQELRIWNFKRLLARKYDVVVTNPPYMGAKGQSPNLVEYLRTEYADTKADTFSAFIERCGNMCNRSCYTGMFSPYVWMFIQSYEKMRQIIYKTKDIVSLIQFEYSAFEEATVPVCTFILRNARTEALGEYIRLVDYRGGMETQRIKTLEAIAEPQCGFRYTTNSSIYSKIPGSPVAYWASGAVMDLFSQKSIAEVADAKVGMRTGDNEKYLRIWHEISIEKAGLNISGNQELKNATHKWIPYNKGGEYRKWYGNRDYVVNWESNGREIKENTKRVYPQLGDNLGWKISNESHYCETHISWTDLTVRGLAFRLFDKGFIFDASANVAFVSRDKLYAVMGYLNTKIVNDFSVMLNPTMHFKLNNFNALPYIEPENSIDIEIAVKDSLAISEADWDSFETSWDFRRHPLICGERTVAGAFAKWKRECDGRFARLKSNEENLNRIFIDSYGLQGELSPEVDDKDVTVRRADLTRDIRSLASYAVGCIFGRYSLDTDGLASAGGEWDSSKYVSYIPSRDSVIPITDEEYLPGDVAARFAEFVRVAYGAETLEENLRFIAKALDAKGATARESIRNYFMKDFYRDHLKTYQKRPIYWLFESGRSDGFKALMYIHRYNRDAVGKLRIDYLHKLQRVYESEISRMRETIDKSNDPRDAAAASKRLEKLSRQLKEAKEYDEKIAHLALSRITLDLDDGVKSNYEKLQTSADGRKHEVLGRI